MNTIQRIVHQMLMYRHKEVMQLLASQPQAMTWFKMVVFSRPYGITDMAFPRDYTWDLSLEEKMAEFQGTEYYWQNRLRTWRN